MCNCVKKINEKLKSAERNTVIRSPISFDTDAYKVQIVTEKEDKSIRKRPATIYSTFCPFCGEKH